MHNRYHRSHLNFFVIGDWGRQGDYGQQETADSMAKQALDSHPEFIISTGDNFYEYGVSSILDPLWRLSYEEVYHHESLQIPWYPVLGNHDYGLNPDAQIEYSEVSERWSMPAKYYTQEWILDSGQKILIVYTDTSPFIEGLMLSSTFASASPAQQAKQLKWVEDQLAESDADWKLVVGHHPVYSTGIMHGDQPEMIELFLPLFEKYKVQAYFCGHDHDIQHLKPSGYTHYIISGAGSMMREAGTDTHAMFTSGENAFAEVNINEDNMHIKFINAEGDLLYQTDIARKVKYSQKAGMYMR